MTWLWAVFAALVVGTVPALVRTLYPPLPPVDRSLRPQVVVVLGAGHRRRQGRYTCGVAGLRRLQEGIHQARARHLPLLLCGGRKRVPAGVPSEAALMAEETRWRAPLLPTWLEENSRNTRENARFAATLLRQRGVRRVLLVTDRPHMTRAMLCFRAQGLEVIPAPVERLPAAKWMPTAGALSLIPEIWYEWLALLWYGPRPR